MKKILRILLILLAQGGVLSLLWSVWLGFGTELAAGMIDPTALSEPFADQNLDELKHEIIHAMAIGWGIGMVFTSIWLLWSSFGMQVLIPADVNTTGWWAVGVMGVLATGIATYPVLAGITLLNSDWRMPLMTLGIVVFGLVYGVGTHFTPPARRAAVPLPYRQPRFWDSTHG